MKSASVRPGNMASGAHVSPGTMLVPLKAKICAIIQVDSSGTGRSDKHSFLIVHMAGPQTNIYLGEKPSKCTYGLKYGKAH